MIRKLIVAAAAALAIGVLAATGTKAEAGHRHVHGGHRCGPAYGVYGGPAVGYGYGYGGVIVAPRVVTVPVAPYPPYPVYGYPYGYGYGYAPYGQAFGLQTGNFSLFLGR
jgi:hypothetical protein